MHSLCPYFLCISRAIANQECDNKFIWSNVKQENRLNESHLKWDESSKMEYWHSCKRFRLVPPLRLAFSFSISKVARSQFHALLVFIWIEPFLQTSSVTRTTVNFQEFSKGIPKALIKSLFRKWIKNRDIPSANIGILTFRFYFFSKSDSSATEMTF